MLCGLSPSQASCHPLQRHRSSHAEWTARQIAEAFPWDSAARYLLHDRDSIYGESFRKRVWEMRIGEVLTAPRSPWQNPYVERLNRINPAGVPGPRDCAQ